MNSDAKIGIGGAPTRATTLPDDPKERKQYPVASGVLDYFPDAIVALAKLSWQGNEQHNPGQPLHWARGKSGDEADTLMRHFLQRGTMDKDGVPHTVKMAWRALAILQKEIEAEQEDATPTVGEHLQRYIDSHKAFVEKQPRYALLHRSIDDPKPALLACYGEVGARHCTSCAIAGECSQKPEGLTPDDRYMS